MNRRQYIASLGFVSTVGVAGCTDMLDLEDNETEGETGNEGGPDSATDETTPADSGSTGSDDETDGEGNDTVEEPLDLGEGISFLTEDERIQLDFIPAVPLPPTVENGVIEDEDGVSVGIPSNEQLLLRVPVRLESTGQEPAAAPQNITLEMDGTTHEHNAYNTVVNDALNPKAQFQPGTTATRSLVFPIAELASSATLAVTWNTSQSTASQSNEITARWTLTADDAIRQDDDITGLETGESVTLTNDLDNTLYTVTAADVSEESIADSDTKRVRVRFSVSSVAFQVDDVPTRDDVVLLGEDDTEYAPQPYDGEDAYDANQDTRQEGVEPGFIVFEVPASVDSYRFRVPLTAELAAVWEL